MPKPLAVQLYTFRDTSRPGAAGLTLDRTTLEAIAEMGFLGVETVDVPGGDPVAARRVLDDVGLRVASSHSWSKPADPEGFERASAAIAALGSTSIIVSGGPFASVADVDALGDQLNAASVVARRHGLALGYHNHSSEMQAFDGVPAYRRLLDRVDPAVVFQVDAFWVVVGGADPATVLGDLDQRVVSIHLKDGVKLPASPNDVPFVNVAVGSGVVDIAGVVAAADRHPGIEWLIVEFDYCEGPPLDAARESHDYLVANGLGRGSRA